MSESLVNVERLLDKLLRGAEEGFGTSDAVNAASREAVRLLLDVARNAAESKSHGCSECAVSTKALLAFDASLAEEKS